MLVVSVRKWHILCCPNSFKKLVIIGRASFISVHTDREARPPEHYHNRFILTHKLQYPCLASIKHPSLVVKCISMAVACKLIVLVSHSSTSSVMCGCCQCCVEIINIFAWFVVKQWQTLARHWYLSSTISTIWWWWCWCCQGWTEIFGGKRQLSW